MKNGRRIVVKIGTSSLTGEGGSINLRRIDELAKVLSGVRNEGNSVVLVTSGAVGVGSSVLWNGVRPSELDGLQAAAAVGQIRLMHIYDKLFGEFGVPVAQVLLTRGNVENEIQRRNCLNAFERLLSLGVIPIVNANDVVNTDEIKELAGFRDNDNLSAVVAELIGADMLIFLTDADGLFDSNPHSNPNAKLIPRVSEVTPEMYANCEGKSTLGTGGMTSKLRAAERMLAIGKEAAIMNSERPSQIYELLAGAGVGTIFSAKK
ncbi:MAG: glutamate 5-kinase [Clostridia bacterium]|nr:glutamate 5-kinase [Clostridia bacterium]MBR5942189.1 glutamate 5-kinase [Clostridia bacterium]